MKKKREGGGVQDRGTTRTKILVGREKGGGVCVCVWWVGVGKRVCG